VSRFFRGRGPAVNLEAMPFRKPFIVTRMMRLFAGGIQGLDRATARTCRDIEADR